MPTDPRDVLVVGGDLAGTAAALAAVRSGARTRLIVQDAQRPGDVEPIPDDPTPQAEDLLDDHEVPAPEELTAFRFRVRRVRRWLDELGIDNDTAWARNLHEAMFERLQREGAAIDQVSAVVRLIGDAEKGISGAVLVDGEDCTTHRADTTVLAGGGIGYLWPEGDDASPPSGWALALRAGLPVGDAGDVAWTRTDDGDVKPFRFVDGVRVDSKGQTEVNGVAACGETAASLWHASPGLAPLADVVRGLEAGDFGGPPAERSEPELVPLVDDPMPPGFAEVKLGRLRGTLAEHAGPEADQKTLEQGHAKLLSLRGEFADYARARAEPELQILHQVADVALAHLDARLED